MTTFDSMAEATPLTALSPLLEAPVVTGDAAPLVVAPNALTKAEIRTSLQASTADGFFATIFSNGTGGVLLSHFLLNLQANAFQIGLLSAIPMIVNLLQPLGAILGDRRTSRQNYNLWIYLPSRFLWLALAIGVGAATQGYFDAHWLIPWTLAVCLLTNLFGALGSASWMSWMAALIPPKLRGRYFGRRNSIISLTNLLTVPLLGLVVSLWPGGSVQGYGVVLMIAVLTGLVSLACQTWMSDINPQVQHLQHLHHIKHAQAIADSSPNPCETPDKNIANLPLPFWQNRNFLIFLGYLAVWVFAVNLSAPFFNVYLLDNLGLGVHWVTIYTSLGAAANLLLMLAWGKLADRIGNRPLLILVGFLVAITPILWLGTGRDALSLWLWFPLLHAFAGGTWAAIDLCNNNLQIGIAPTHKPSTYFAIAAAAAGVSGALGTTVGGLLAEYANLGGVLGLFVLSTLLRLVALVPLFWVQESGSHSVTQILQPLTQSIRTWWLGVEARRGQARG